MITNKGGNNKAMVIEKNISLDITNYDSFTTVKIKQYDNNVHRLNISLNTSDGSPFVIDADTTAKLRMTKPDGYTVYKNCSIADNIISVVLDGSISTAYGKAPAEIGLYKKEELLLSSTFCINIIKSAIDEGGIISSDDFGALTEIIEKSEATISACEEATQNADNATQLATATAEDIKQKADSGDFNGFTPEIGENGNWYINNIDTGKPSVGKIPEIIPINQGGTGNNIGYIQTGKLSSTTAGEKATIEGVDNKAFGKYSHAEGKKNFAKGNYSHAEGSNMNYDETELNNRKITSDIIPELSETITISGTSAYGMSSHAEGAQTLAFGDCSHAEGTWCVSGDKNAHSEGYNSQAIGDCSHAEGADTKASGAKSHAEGEFTRAEGAQSHSEGYRTVAKGACCHVQGRYNTIDDNSKYLHIVGNGNSDSNRKNCHTIDEQGNTWYSGKVYLGGRGQDDTEAYIASVPKYGQADTDIVLMVKNGTLTWVSKNEFISEIMSKMNN